MWRTRETFKEIVIGGEFDNGKLDFKEEPRIREQEWGHLRSVEESALCNEARDNYGTFYYRIPNGESGADVFDRMASFFDSLHRDFQKEDFPVNCAIVTHGMTIRLFLMKWFHWTVEQYEEMRNPYNCQIFEFARNQKNKYDLLTEITKYPIGEKYKSLHQFPLVL